MPPINPFWTWAKRLPRSLRAHKAGKGKVVPGSKARREARPVSTSPMINSMLPDHRMWIPKLGWVNMAENLRFTGKVTGARITKTADWWFVSLTVEMPDELQSARLPPLASMLA